MPLPVFADQHHNHICEAAGGRGEFRCHIAGTDPATGFHVKGMPLRMRATTVAWNMNLQRDSGGIRPRLLVVYDFGAVQVGLGHWMEPWIRALAVQSRGTLIAAQDQQEMSGLPWKHQWCSAGWFLRKVRFHVPNGPRTRQVTHVHVARVASSTLRP